VGVGANDGIGADLGVMTHGVNDLCAGADGTID